MTSAARALRVAHPDRRHTAAARSQVDDVPVGVAHTSATLAPGYSGTRATQKTVWPNGGRITFSMARVVGTTVRS